VLGVFISCHAADESQPESNGTVEPEESPLSDGEIAHIVRTVNSTQIDQAEVALLRLNRVEDRSFAEQTISDHAASNSKVSALTNRPELEPEDNIVSIQLKSESDRTVATLQEASDDSIDLAYIDAQVMAYAKLVTLFENQLLADARDPELRAVLETNRDRIRQNWSRAIELDQALGP
jgi:putative membrane protein